jgi:hypothetical protein
VTERREQLVNRQRPLDDRLQHELVRGVERQECRQVGRDAQKAARSPGPGVHGGRAWRTFRERSAGTAGSREPDRAAATTSMRRISCRYHLPESSVIDEPLLSETQALWLLIGVGWLVVGSLALLRGRELFGVAWLLLGVGACYRMFDSDGKTLSGPRRRQREQVRR